MEKLRLTNAGYYTNAAMLLLVRIQISGSLALIPKSVTSRQMRIFVIRMRFTALYWNRLIKSWKCFYLKFMKAKISYEGIQRIERYFVADEALREALLNALCHGLWKAFHKRCYAKLIIIQSQFRNPF